MSTTDIADRYRRLADRFDRVAARREIRPVVQALLTDPQTAGHACDGYFSPTTFAQRVDTFYSLDLLVHAWDLARAAGLTDMEAMPADEVTDRFESLRPFSETLRQPGVCGPELEPPPGADEQTRFLAILGRRV